MSGIAITPAGKDAKAADALIAEFNAKAISTDKWSQAFKAERYYAKDLAKEDKEVIHVLVQNNGWTCKRLTRLHVRFMYGITVEVSRNVGNQYNTKTIDALDKFVKEVAEYLIPPHKIASTNCWVEEVMPVQPDPDKLITHLDFFAGIAVVLSEIVAMPAYLG